MPAQGCCNPGFQIRLEVIATLKGLRRNFAESQQASQPLQGCEESVTGTMTQGFKANPGLELANAFSVLRRLIKRCVLHNILSNRSIGSCNDRFEFNRSAQRSPTCSMRLAMLRMVKLRGAADSG